MDCVEGLATDRQAVLTLYSRASHLRLALLLPAKDCGHVKGRLRARKSICGPDLYNRLTQAVTKRPLPTCQLDPQRSRERLHLP